MILIVEDEFMLAFGMEEMLLEAGLGPVTVAGRVSRAIETLEGGGVRMAFVDVNLGRETSEAVVERLRGEGVPFAMCTAYSAEQLPGFVGEARVLHKPIDEATLLNTARDLGGA